MVEITSGVFCCVAEKIIFKIFVGRNYFYLSLAKNKIMGKKLLRQVLYDKHTKEELISMVRDGVYRNDSKKDRELAEAITGFL